MEYARADNAAEKLKAMVSNTAALVRGGKEAEVSLIAVGVALTVSPPANTLGLVPVPLLYWLFPAIILLGYAVLTQGVKTWFIRRCGE